MVVNHYNNKCPYLNLLETLIFPLYKNNYRNKNVYSSNDRARKRNILFGSVIFLKKVERFTIRVESVHEDQGILIGSTEEGKRRIVKGSYQDIYPSDTITISGTAEKNKRLGIHYRLSHYIEEKDENWMIKRLKYELKKEDKDILKVLLHPAQAKEKEKYTKETEQIKRLFAQLEAKGIAEECLAKIERDFLWNYSELLEDVYQLLRYPSIRIDWLEEWIKTGDNYGKKETKANFYAQQLLQEANAQGHFYLPKSILAKSMQRKGLSLESLKENDMFVVTNDRYYLKEFYDMEEEIAQHIYKRVLEKPTETFAHSAVEDWEKEKGFTLAENQKEAVKMALQQSFSVVTGGPGVGKTTVCKCITDILGSKYSIKMVAPTGRAAKRAQESTGLDASTIHSLLEYNGISFKRDSRNPIDTKVLVVDESSMVDAPLSLALLKAIPADTIIIFVGDVDQLPSVGPGQILRDLIESNAIPITRLTEIFRQAADSPIIQCAYTVNEGNVPEKESHPLLEYHEYASEVMVSHHVLQVAKKLYQEHSPFDVQILIPMYDGEVGIDNINKQIQQYLHSNVPSVQVENGELRLGDKVIQTKNDRIKKIYNGDIGIITALSSNQIKVKYQGQSHESIYSSQEFWQLQLAYAVTVHRAQGSEYAYVIIPIVLSYKNMLQKNLLYTAITRTKRKLWMIYQESALEQAVRLESVPKRYTGLANKLKEQLT
ncbi:hypothetical protein CN918_26810 [Priestia megaterium]|nr:hypothetical protein CN918_26810 [Priestia megaterium]